MFAFINYALKTKLHQTRNQVVTFTGKVFSVGLNKIMIAFTLSTILPTKPMKMWVLRSFHRVFFYKKVEKRYSTGKHDSMYKKGIIYTYTHVNGAFFGLSGYFYLYSPEVKICVVR